MLNILTIRTAVVSLFCCLRRSPVLRRWLRAACCGPFVFCPNRLFPQSCVRDDTGNDSTESGIVFPMIDSDRFVSYGINRFLL